MTDSRANSTRTKARRRAIDILYEAEARGVDPRDILADRIALGEPPVRPFTIALVTAVAEDIDAVDAALRDALGERWSLERMPAVDRAIARLAIHELRAGDVPVPVTVSVAVDLAGELSTEKSPGFLNALLDRAARAGGVRTEAGDQPAEESVPD